MRECRPSARDCFFEEMRDRLGGGGDFAEAYVIAHEVGHHVQALLGLSRDVDEARRMGESVSGAEAPLVRQELQADCFAGVWAYHGQSRHQWLDPGGVEEALATATAIGDDRLQRKSQGDVVPDAFTHGTSEQRVRWFTRGVTSEASSLTRFGFRDIPSRKLKKCHACTERVQNLAKTRPAGVEVALHPVHLGNVR